VYRKCGKTERPVARADVEERRFSAAPEAGTIRALAPGE